MSFRTSTEEEAKTMEDLKLKRCPKCGKMVKRGSDLCKCGALITEQACLLHFQSRPRMFGFIRRFAEQRGITIEEAMVGFLALGVKTFNKGFGIRSLIIHENYI